jgi:hypothetical protein
MFETLTTLSSALILTFVVVSMLSMGLLLTIVPRTPARVRVVARNQKALRPNLVHRTRR